MTWLDGAKIAFAPKLLKPDFFAGKNGFTETREMSQIFVNLVPGTEYNFEVCYFKLKAYLVQVFTLFIGFRNSNEYVVFSNTLAYRNYRR